jgi:hypothetical protein
MDELQLEPPQAAHQVSAQRKGHEAAQPLLDLRARIHDRVGGRKSHEAPRPWKRHKP